VPLHTKYKNEHEMEPHNWKGDELQRHKHCCKTVHTSMNVPISRPGDHSAIWQSNKSVPIRMQVSFPPLRWQLPREHHDNQSINQSVQLEASPWKARVRCHTAQKAKPNDAPTKAQRHDPRCPFRYERFSRGAKRCDNSKKWLAESSISQCSTCAAWQRSHRPQLLCPCLPPSRTRNQTLPVWHSKTQKAKQHFENRIQRFFGVMCTLFCK
jgi:hypothetical protein